jgi:hypothetical protein
MDALTLEKLKQNVREVIVSSIDEAVTQLLEALPANRPKHRQLVMLRGRHHSWIEYKTNNTLDLDKLLILENELRQDVLLFTDTLTLSDFMAAPAGRPELKPGHLLYQIPDKMKLRERHACRVRIAHRLNQLLENLDPTVHHEIEMVPVAEVMEVEIIDPSAENEPAFNILLVSDGEQFVDEYSFTEWVFYVRPLREGPQELLLKVSVLITVNDRERTKNLVFTRSIEVGAEAEATPPIRRVEAARSAPKNGGGNWTAHLDQQLGESPIQGRINTKGPGSGSNPPVAPIETPRVPTKRGSAPWMKIAAAVVFLVVATFLIFPPSRDQKDPVGPVDGPTEDFAISTRRESGEVITGPRWQAMRTELLRRYETDPSQELVITGNYFPNEAAPAGYDDMGKFRAEQIKKLLIKDIPEAKITTESRLKNRKIPGKQESVEAGSFQWRATPVTPPERDLRREDIRKTPERIDAPKRIIVPRDTASIRRINSRN